MDSIEHFFGVAPDGGTGAAELLYFAVVLSIVSLYRWGWTIGAIIIRRLGR